MNEDGETSLEKTPEFADARAFQLHVLGEIAALRAQLKEIDVRQDSQEVNTDEFAARLIVLHNHFERFLDKTAPWLENVQTQLERIERKFDSLMTRIDELIDDMLELRARKRDSEPNEWTN